MRLQIIVSLFALAGIAVLSTACRSGEPIDSETAMSLLKDRNMEPVRLTFSASPPANADANVTSAYNTLVDAHVITCTTTKGMGTICQPGPAGDGVSQVGSAELAVIAGRWVPSAITSLSRADGSTATAEVRMRFELNPLYRDFENAFDTIQLWSGKSAIDNKREGKVSHAVFQRYDDGWHLDNLS